MTEEQCDKELIVGSGDHAGVKWINGTCLACDFCQQAGESPVPESSQSEALLRSAAR